MTPHLFILAILHDVATEAAFVAAVRALGPAAHVLGLGWLVQTPIMPDTALRRLYRHLQPQDRLMILQVTGHWAVVNG